MKKFRTVHFIVVIALLWSVFLSACSHKVEQVPTPTSIPLAPSYNDVLDYYRSGITDLQRLNYQETKLLGHRVEWSGWVINTREDLNDFRQQIIILDMSGDTDEFGGKINLIGLDDVFGTEAQVDLRLYFAGIVEDIDQYGMITVRVDSLMDNPQAGSVSIESYESLLLANQTLDNREWMRVRQNSIGTKVQWIGYVINVNEEGVAILSSQPDSEEIEMMLSGLSSEKALALHLGQEYSFSATIVKIDTDEVIQNSHWEKIVQVYLNAGGLTTPSPDTIATPTDSKTWR